MIIRTIFALLALTIASVCPALAADMPVKQAAARNAMAAENASWTGCYLGVHTGYGLGHSKIDAMGGATLATFDEKGGLVGAQFGCDVQAGQFIVVGIGATGTWLGGIKDSVSGVKSQFDWMGTVDARVGVLLTPDWLIGAKGGLAFAKTGLLFGPISTDDVRLGYDIGGFTEYRFAKNWSWLLGADYTNFGRNTQFIVLSQKSDIWTFKTGLNLRF